MAGLDRAIEAKRRAIADLEQELAGIGHRIARAFQHERTDDKTAKDLIKSAEKALGPRGTKLGQAVAASGYLDPGASEATVWISMLQAEAEALAALEAARADMAGAAKAYGASAE